ncbi:serine/arginine repetitive matrix protein 3-like [Dasypus novemcinctus]|uniref:serine/arginine repetitive matrix protein 3-like n=1 Tax=Dasypus novemcinctus TaxID=9361 RepID=UPI0039C8E092
MWRDVLLGRDSQWMQLEVQTVQNTSWTEQDSGQVFLLLCPGRRASLAPEVQGRPLRARRPRPRSGDGLTAPRVARSGSNQGRGGASAQFPSPHRAPRGRPGGLDAALEPPLRDTHFPSLPLRWLPPASPALERSFLSFPSRRDRQDEGQFSLLPTGGRTAAPRGAAARREPPWRRAGREAAGAGEGLRAPAPPRGAARGRATRPARSPEAPLPASAGQPPAARGGPEARRAPELSERGPRGSPRPRLLRTVLRSGAETRPGRTHWRRRRFSSRDPPAPLGPQRRRPSGWRGSCRSRRGRPSPAALGAGRSSPSLAPPSSRWDLPLLPRGPRAARAGGGSDAPRPGEAGGARQGRRGPACAPSSRGRGGCRGPQRVPKFPARRRSPRRPQPAPCAPSRGPADTRMRPLMQDHAATSHQPGRVLVRPLETGALLSPLAGERLLPRSEEKPARTTHGEEMESGSLLNGLPQ